jgi:hypothetical protein
LRRASMRCSRKREAFVRDREFRQEKDAMGRRRGHPSSLMWTDGAPTQTPNDLSSNRARNTSCAQVIWITSPRERKIRQSETFDV